MIKQSINIASSRKITAFILMGLALLFTAPLFAQTIKVMSYNIRLDVKSDGENQWDKRKEKVAALMNYYEPDFIGDQEVQHHQLLYLSTQLTNYGYIGVGRDDGNEGGEYSCIFYRKDKFTLIQQATFWLSPTPDSVSIGWDAACKRVCTYGLFQSKESGQRCWVFNTHLDHIGVVAREQAAKLIMQKITDLNKRNKYPVILTGDLNSKPEDIPVQILTKKLLNAREQSISAPYGPLDTWEAFDFTKKPDGCIDYIFINNKIKVLKFATITDSYDQKYPSDHFPVMATLQLIKK